MTREEILGMSAGRELDAIVAEKVMNLCVLDTVQGYGDGCVVSEKGMDEWITHPLCGKFPGPDILPTYSTDVSSAWEVVEELNGKYSFTIQRLGDYFYQDEDYGWDAIFSSYSDRKVTAKSASEAICKAALLAKLEV